MQSKNRATGYTDFYKNKLSKSAAGAARRLAEKTKDEADEEKVSYYPIRSSKPKSSAASSVVDRVKSEFNNPKSSRQAASSAKNEAIRRRLARKKVRV